MCRPQKRKWLACEPHPSHWNDVKIAVFTRLLVLIVLESIGKILWVIYRVQSVYQSSSYLEGISLRGGMSRVFNKVSDMTILFSIV
jgi:hypothetical protein